MSVDTLLMFAITEFVLCLTPGPAVFLVVTMATRRGALAGVATGAGVTAGTAFYFALSALGVGALIVASHMLFVLLKWVGGAYLVYLGGRLLWPLMMRRRSSISVAPQPADDTAATAKDGLWPVFFKGFAVQLANPKTLMFFMALFPQFIAPEGNVALQFSLMAIVSATLEMPILIAYALLASASSKWVRGRVALWFDGVSGAILIAIGAAMAMSRGR